MSTVNEKSFKIFPAMGSGCGYLYDSMENTPKENTSDEENNRACCGCVLCLTFWPLYLVYDIISCPIRGCIHMRK